MHSELVLGYDPGGDGAHGVALLPLSGVSTERVETQTFETTQSVIEYIESLSTLVALGVDTLTCWSTGRVAGRSLAARSLPGSPQQRDDAQRFGRVNGSQWHECPCGGPTKVP